MSSFAKHVMHLDCENCGTSSALGSIACTGCAEPFGFAQRDDAQWEPNDYGMWLYSQHFQICERRDSHGLDALSEAETLNCLIGYLYYQVHNGGVWQYLANPCGTDALRLVAALREIGAARHAQALAECLRFFPDGVPPDDQDARDDIIGALAENSANALAARVSKLVCDENSPEKLLVLLRLAVLKAEPPAGVDPLA